MQPGLPSCNPNVGPVLTFVTSSAPQLLCPPALPSAGGLLSDPIRNHSFACYFPQPFIGRPVSSFGCWPRSPYPHAPSSALPGEALVGRVLWICPPRPPPRLAYVPHVTLLLLLFPSPLPSRPECGLLWHDFPSRSLLWLSPVQPFSWTREALANCEVPQNHGAVSTVRAKLGTSLGGGPAWFGERAGRCHAEETACAVPGSGPT